MSKKVVFVDDSKAILASVDFAVEALVAEGKIEFVSFINPLELLEKAKSGELVYDMLFTDINMPQMNGFDLASNLKQIGALKQKPIIALTTENSNEMKQRGKEIGIAGWITKPFNEAKIVGAITKVLAL